MLHWRLNAFFLSCVLGIGHAAALTRGDAIALAKSRCAKQTSNQPALKWDAFPIGDTWAVGATQPGKQGIEGWPFSIPAHGPPPKQCVRYTVQGSMGVQP